MQLKITSENKILIVALLVFLIAFCWQLFCTYGFDFFGEDFDVFHVYWERTAEFQKFQERYLPDSIQPSRFTLALGIGKEYIKQFFAPRRLLQIGFNSYSQTDRPYQFLTWDLLKVFFGNNAMFYRVFKSIIFALNTCFIFFIILRVSKLFAILGVMLYMTSAEIWLSALYLNNLGLLAQCATIISVFLFIKLIDKGPLSRKEMWLYYILILLVSNCAVLTFGDARYLAIIFFLTIVFFRRKELKLHAPMLVLLLLMQFPIMGYFKKIFLDRTFAPINLTSHVNTSPSMLSTLFWSISNYRFFLNAMGKLIFVLLLIPIATYLLSKTRQILTAAFSKGSGKKKALFAPRNKEIILLSALWFICSFIMVAKVRNFRYGSDPISFMLYDLAYFIAPLIIFYCCYFAAIVNSDIKIGYRKSFLTLCICLIFLQLLSNVNRLSKFREKGAIELCSWKNAERFIEQNSDNALALALTKSQYRPFVFYNSANSVMSTQLTCEESEFCNIDFLEEKFNAGGYDDIFIISSEELRFRGNPEAEILQEKAMVDSDTGDLYDRLRRRLGHKFKDVINIYHFKKAQQAI